MVVLPAVKRCCCSSFVVASSVLVIAGFCCDLAAIWPLISHAAAVVGLLLPSKAIDYMFTVYVLASGVNVT